MQVDLSILIVSYNTRGMLCECLRSILQQTRQTHYEIVVVDNASTDDSAAAVRWEFPGVRVIENSTNVGFSEANNQAIANTTGRYLLLLNADTVIFDGALDRMVRYLDEHPETGIAGAKMYDATGRPWRYETWDVTPWKYLLGRWLVRLSGDRGTTEVDWVCGACLMIRREVVDRIGPLDAFMFGEDWDWCYRARQAGWKVVHLGHARILHYWGGSAGTPELSPGRLFVTRQSRVYYAQKHFGRTYGALFAFALMVEAVTRTPLLAFRLAVEGTAARRLRLRGQIAGYHRLLKSMARGALLKEDRRWWNYRA